VTWADEPAGLRCGYDFSATPDIVLACAFMGVENFYGHILEWDDGINIEFVGSPLTDANVYLCNDPAAWADDTAIGYTDAGFDLPLTSDYITDIADGYFVPVKAIGGNASAFLADYYKASDAAGWRAPRSGGYLPDGLNAGIEAMLADADVLRRASGVGGRTAA
jgi:hypothetical protein